MFASVLSHRLWLLCTLTLLAWLIVQPHSYGANNQNKNLMYAVARIDSTGSRISLRWAVSDPRTWQIANKYGYIIERYTIMQNGKLLSTPSHKLLSSPPIKPLPLNGWKQVIENNDNAAIIAQGLYGETFSAQAGNDKLAQVIAQNDELMQRYTFSLMAADRDFRIACMAGWGLTDTTAMPGEKYLYRIYAKLNASGKYTDTALVYIGKDNYYPLPVPRELTARYGDKTVMLSWNNSLLKDEYSSYFVERSTDGTHFSKVSDLPTTTVGEKENELTGSMFYSDSLPDNDQIVYYRVRGINCFGETGPPSETVSGRGQKTVPWIPVITDTEMPNDSTVIITWNYPEEGKATLDHFALELSSNPDEGHYQTVQANIDGKSRQTTFSALLPSNYFAITAIDIYGGKRTSFPRLVQAADSVPPAVPIGLLAQADSTGTVTVTWAANKESDLLGYYILYKNNLQEEASIINATPITGNTYTEKISLSSLNNKIYYAVIALDKRMNQSAPSTFAEAVKPDKIPPVAPVFTGYKADNNGSITLRWVNGFSDDVEKIQLLRKPVGNGDWEIIKALAATDTTYRDENLNDGSKATYALRAVDKSGNESGMSVSLSVTARNTTPVTITKFSARVQRDLGKISLTWQVKGEKVSSYTLYRSVDGKPYTLWKIVNTPENKIEDTMPATDTIYKYALRANLTDGQIVGWKETVVGE
jgi:fibronectin type 3 domain-containing protein